ncbi:hypothetical protein [Peribacillus butanolivorans]|uniref:hypothetical protein n=1 Tax=Peribacillus butanolivorans TaxID=421767 RepID=UPI00365411E8
MTERFEPGKTVSFRLPPDTPLHVVDYLTQKKNELGRKFSSEIAPIFVEAVSQKALGNAENAQISITLPEGLTADQKEWVKHPNTKALISQLLYQVVTKPTTPLDFDQQLLKDPVEEKEPVFKTNAMIQSFAQKTFLNFDEDDD